MVTVHDPVPVQSPDQPAKIEPDPALAVRLTVDPEGNCAEQLAPQLIPGGELTTVPEPAPVLVTVNGALPASWGQLAPVATLARTLPVFGSMVTLLPLVSGNVQGPFAVLRIKSTAWLPPASTSAVLKAASFTERILVVTTITTSTREKIE
ncbi:MAG: hypothetical protein KatS3mg125_0810 [Lysobacterales bacterium]|jgi:hypothetical protein|nr:MAG: hypothetical protein KatS3mg125_0810 [Xanthomonadales bacterium]